MTQRNQELINSLRNGQIYKLTVLELYQMLKDGALHTDQSTQRSFIYDKLESQLSVGKVSKASALIYAILVENVKLPALTFWYNTDTNQLNVMDGKQRLLSIKSFIDGEISSPVSANGRSSLIDALTKEQKTKLASYTFFIQVNEGASAEEEFNFDAINSNGEPLKAYECLRGKSYGKWLDGFEDYIEAKAKILDGIKPIGRGEQAMAILYGLANISDSKKATYNSSSYKLLSEFIAHVRHTSFDATVNKFDEKLQLFAALKALKNCDLSDYTAMSIACSVIRNGYNADIIIDLYRRLSKGANDMKSWDIPTHRTFILAKIMDDLELDPLRFFSEADKNTLYNKDNQCAYVDPITGVRCSVNTYKELEVDHIIPWSKGGRTNLDNAQLMCKHHNASKGNAYDSVAF